jgi:hypothetical protein
VPHYSAYGLTLDSELPFPELSPSAFSEKAISIQLGDVDLVPSLDAPRQVLYKPISTTDVIVHYAGVGSALVRNGSSIIFEPATNADPLPVRLFLLQQVVGVALLQRGYLVLHASATTIGNNAIAFCGPSGQGKSTMVAALNRSGFSVLTDDVLAIDLSGGEPIALPGLAQLKLTEDARKQVAPAIPAGQPIRHRNAKSLCETSGLRATRPVPISEIYLLDTGPTLSFTTLPKARAAIELVRHTYGSRLLQAINLSSSHFAKTASLARQAPVTILSRPRDFGLLPQIVERIRRRLPSQVPSVCECDVR